MCSIGGVGTPGTLGNLFRILPFCSAIYCFCSWNIQLCNVQGTRILVTSAGDIDVGRKNAILQAYPQNFGALHGRVPHPSQRFCVVWRLVLRISDFGARQCPCNIDILCSIRFAYWRNVRSYLFCLSWHPSPSQVWIILSVCMDCSLTCPDLSPEQRYVHKTTCMWTSIHPVNRLALCLIIEISNRVSDRFSAGTSLKH